MKKQLILFASIFSLMSPVFAQPPDNRDIRRIVFEFMNPGREITKEDEENLYLTEDREKEAAKKGWKIIPTLSVYDMTNKKEIVGHDPIPVQEGLIKYIIQRFGPHELGYLMVVKNGVHEIINMGAGMNDILDQVLSYSNKNRVSSDELFDILQSVILLKQGNDATDGSIQIIRTRAVLDGINKSMIAQFLLTDSVSMHTLDKRLCVIVRDFLMEKSGVSNAGNFADSLAFAVYDATNDVGVVGTDRVPVERRLLLYHITVGQTDSFSYLMLVKNGIYEIIDIGESLNNILDQIIRYSRNNEMSSSELLDVLESVLRLYKSNSSVCGDTLIVPD